MKKYNLLFLTILLCASLPAQEASFASRLRQFSPLADIHVRNLGLEDKNGSGTIDRGAGEGYETFIEKYGNADTGFYANGVIIGANNGRLEENEILNHYYINIRFKPAFMEETGNIDEAVTSYAYANSVPLVWLDDEQGTVMNAITRVLGEGWNEREVAEDEAVRMFNRAVQGMRIIGRIGQPSNNGGYYSLPEMVNRRAGYCFEAAQFGFWFFSELKINSVSALAALNQSISHEVVRLNSGRRVDYFGSSNRYNIPADNWHVANPLQSIGTYYRVKGDVSANQNMLEQAVIHDKHSIDNIGRLMDFYFNNTNSPNYTSIKTLGEFFLENNDIANILSARRANPDIVKNKVKIILLMLLVSYSETNNKPGTERISVLLQRHYPRDAVANVYLNTYSLY